MREEFFSFSYRFLEKIWKIQFKLEIFTKFLLFLRSSNLIVTERVNIEISFHLFNDHPSIRSKVFRKFWFNYFNNSNYFEGFILSIVHLIEKPTIDIAF